MADNYEQFGQEWKKEIMKFKKSEIIELYKLQCIARLKAELKIRQNLNY